MDPSEHLRNNFQVYLLRLTQKYIVTADDFWIVQD